MKKQMPGVYIDGHWSAPHSTTSIKAVNPATEETLGDIPDCDAADVDAAVRAAETAFRSSGWAQLTPAERSPYLRRLGDELQSRSKAISELVTSENGSPITVSRSLNGEKPSALVRYYAELAQALEVEEVRTSAGRTPIVRREPVGVAALIVAWNGPQSLAAKKIVPALVAGCCVVMKPSPETSFDAKLIMDSVEAAGVPPGVVNMVTGGVETGRALVRHPQVRKVSFTGSTGAGRDIATACASTLKRVSLELGGKSAAIILEDADLDAFLALAPRVCLNNTGQGCLLSTRVLAPRSRYEEICDGLVDRIASLKVGDPMDEDTAFGPVVSARQRQRVEGYLDRGRSEGAKCLTGGGRPRQLPRGFCVEPTIFSAVSNNMTIAREEIFGPVLVVIPVDSEDEAIKTANASDYGLGGTVFTRDAAHGADVARRIETGTIGVNGYTQDMNAPFGGVKQSGIGREQGPEGLDSYFELKSIYVDVR